MTAFDTITDEFTRRIGTALNWKENYLGAAYSTRIAAAIEDLEEAIANVKVNSEIREAYEQRAKARTARIERINAGL